MRKIIASLDIGSSLIKLVVGEVFKNKLNILACVDTPARGIKKGYVINSESAKECLKEIFQKVENILGIPINKVIVSVPAFYTDCFLATSTIAVTNEDKLIKNKDIVKAMEKCIKDKVDDGREVISVQPSGFKINDEIVANPLNMFSEKLTMKSVVVTVPNKNTVGIQKVLESIGIEVVENILTPLGDFYQNKTKDFNNSIGAIVNIGDETTTVSIFNKGILTNLEVIDLGGDAITNDLSYVYKISKEDAKDLKEHLALAHTRLAQPNESMTFVDKHNEDIKINQYDASEVVMSRLIEIINLAKKQINLLTKKEISYIIVTGGVTETQDFDILIEEQIGSIGIISAVTEIGARNNIYATAVGMIKYFNSRLKLTGNEFSILSIEEQEEFGGIDKKINIPENSLLGKLFGYFFDN